MDWKDTDSEMCPVAGAMSILGDKWTLLILRDAFNGLRRFADFEYHLGLSRPLLASRLKKLTTDGILIRQPYQAPGERVRYEYRLTEKGRDLQFIMIGLREWGDKYTDRQSNPVSAVVEGDTGEEVTLRLARVSDGASVNPRALRVVMMDKKAKTP